MAQGQAAMVQIVQIRSLAGRRRHESLRPQSSGNRTWEARQLSLETVARRVALW